MCMWCGEMVLSHFYEDKSKCATCCGINRLLSGMQSDENKGIMEVIMEQLTRVKIANHRAREIEREKRELVALHEKQYEEMTALRERQYKEIQVLVGKE